MIVEKETLEEVFEYINSIEKDKEFFVTIHLNGGGRHSKKCLINNGKGKK